MSNIQYPISNDAQAGACTATFSQERHAIQLRLATGSDRYWILDIPCWIFKIQSNVELRMSNDEVSYPTSYTTQKNHE